MSRLDRVLNDLKGELREAGAEYRKTQDKALVSELTAITDAINALEVHMFDKRITNVMDSLG